MMKRMMAMLLVLLMLAGGAALAAATTGETGPATETEAVSDDRYFEDPAMGLKFRWPDAWYSALYEDACLAPSGYSGGFALDYLTGAANEAITKLMTEFDPMTPEEQYTPEQKQLIEQFNTGLIPLCAFAAEKDGVRDQDLHARYPEEKPLGKVDGTEYTLLTNAKADLSALPEAEQQQFKALIEATAEFEQDITLSGIKEITMEGGIQFSSQTTGGEPIDSSVFQDNKLTMVNIWATWCGPCVNELPELQKLSERMPEGTKLLGICTDAQEEAELTEQILEKSGVTYPNIVADSEMTRGFLTNVQAYPTTIFVDSQGNIVGEPFQGAPSSDVVQTYLDVLDERLALLGN